MNFVSGAISSDGASVELDLPGANRLPLLRPLESGRRVSVGLRPEHLEICEPAVAHLTLPVAVVESTGSLTYVTTAGECELTVVITGRSDIKAGQAIGLSIAPQRVHLFNPDTDEVI